VDCLLFGEKNGNGVGTKLNTALKSVLDQKKLPRFNLEAFYLID
jgi:hypothetical protein